MSHLYEITEEQVIQLAEAYSDYRAAQKAIWNNGRLNQKLVGINRKPKWVMKRESSRLEMNLRVEAITLRHIQKATGVELVRLRELDHDAKAVEQAA
tara:strand:+ start:178 stop:468 length:291 start_codon:yes stop_codon:yes gene_type:complete